MTMARQIMWPEDELEFYRQQSEISSPGRFNALFDGLPTDVSELCQVIQNLLIHQFWILDEKNYGITAETLKSSGRNLNDEINLRSVEEILEFIMELDNSPLTAPREVDRRVVGNCRDYSVMLVSMLRRQGVPARVRSGVARYFYASGEDLEDHFVCEFWNESKNSWQRTDAQIDQVQLKALQLKMDMTDLPENQFLDAGESYEELKSGRVKPERIGIFEFKGWKYVNYKLVSDLACVNNVEVLPWEGWGMCGRISEGELSEEDEALLQEIAINLTALRADPNQYGEAKKLFAHPDLQMPTKYEPYYHELPFFK
jgi:hypothetical protein